MLCDIDHGRSFIKMPKVANIDTKIGRLHGEAASASLVDLKELMTGKRQCSTKRSRFHWWIWAIWQCKIWDI